MSEDIRNPFIKNEAKSTRSSAIKAKCAECMGCTIDHLETNWTRSIKECSSFDCPLHPFRPFK